MNVKGRRDFNTKRIFGGVMPVSIGFCGITDHHRSR